VGADTQAVNKTRFLPIQKKWDVMFDYIERTPSLADILVSGGDTYTLGPDQLHAIVQRLLEMPHILRVRIASKGMAVCPSRLVDPKDDWASNLIDLARRGRKMGKSVALHTHFNHPREITWITKMAAQRLFEEGVVVRNQTVLLNGVNNTVDTMKELIQQLASINIQPVCFLFMFRASFRLESTADC
jgi:lysine 2,3-aminomutase